MVFAYAPVRLRWATHLLLPRCLSMGRVLWFLLTFGAGIVYLVRADGGTLWARIGPVDLPSSTVVTDAVGKPAWGAYWTWSHD